MVVHGDLLQQGYEIQVKPPHTARWINIPIPGDNPIRALDEPFIFIFPSGFHAYKVHLTAREGNHRQTFICIWKFYFLQTGHQINLFRNIIHYLQLNIILSIKKSFAISYGQVIFTHRVTVYWNIWQNPQSICKLIKSDSSYIEIVAKLNFVHLRDKFNCRHMQVLSASANILSIISFYWYLWRELHKHDTFSFTASKRPTIENLLLKL